MFESESSPPRTTTIGQSSYLKGRIGWQGLRASEFTDHGPYLVTGTDFCEGRIIWDNCYHVSEARFAEASYIQLRNRDLLVTKDGTIGKIAFVTDCPEKAVLNSGIFLLRCTDGSFEQEYLFHILNSHFFERFLANNLAGSTITHLYQYVFAGFEFPIPDNKQQCRISEILMTLDEEIGATQKLVEKHRQIKAGLMHDLFTRGLWSPAELARGDHQGFPCEATAQVGQLRPTPEEAPGLYQESSLGLIPKAWRAEKLDNLLAKTGVPMRSGPFGSALLKDELVENGIPLLGIDNVFVERFEPTFRRFVSRWKFTELSRYAVFAGDVVITIMGTVGRCCVLPENIGQALSSKHLWTMTFDTNQVLPELVCWQLNHAAWVKNWFLRHAQGAVMDAIQSSTLRTLWLPVPPIDEQREILTRYHAVSGNIDIAEINLAKLRQQKQGLMHDLLTGRVPVELNS